MKGTVVVRRKQKIMLARILAAAAMLVVLNFIPATGWLRFVLYMAPYLTVGYDILIKALKGIRNRQVFDENFLMAIATVGAIGLALYERSGDYLEAVAVMLFYQIGEWFQSYAVGKSRRNISELMDIRPDYANVERDGRLERVDPAEVEVGGMIVVQPGEKVPIDGKVVQGESTLNTAALTGESLPREVRVGDEIISGCINMTGVLKIETTKEFGESTVSKILDLVENASSRKSKSEDFISKFARVYTPAVCIAALALALLPPVVRMLFMGAPAQWGTWIYRALTFLVISCPCALVISIPLSFFAGIGGASNAGVLVKGSNYLETLSQTKIVVFDKTGTLTQGVFEVSGIHHSEMENAKLLEYAALAESASSHPISKSLRKAYGREIDRSRVADIREISGNGVVAKVDGREVAVGNDKLMNQLNVPFIPCHSTGTIIHMAIDGQYAGHIVISDVLKPTAQTAVQSLKASGMRRTVMLTGDAKKVADQVGAELGIDEIHSELLPADKVAKVEEILEREAGAREVGVRRRRHQRRAGAAAGRHRHCDGRAGLRCRHRGRRRRAYGRRSAEDRQGDPDFAQVPEDRLSEHCVRHRRQADLPRARRAGHCQHVARDLCRCRRDGDRRAQRHSRAVCQEPLRDGLDLPRLRNAVSGARFPLDSCENCG